MGQFRLLKQYPKSENPVVRVDMRHYQLLRDMHDDSGVSMSQIIAQCIDFALRNGGEWGRNILNENRIRCPYVGRDMRRTNP